ncbi:MAG TPA: hypothetical protein VLV78_01790 [Thermoanaerobaculia bacterium]|nr:hypothetical protein [Thermoanaerobaculia bacterium]
MTNAEFLAAFEACSLDEFHHRDHIRAAWCYLAANPLLEAVQRFTASLKRFAGAHGQPQLYHETITWAFLFLVHERMRAGEAWNAFAARNPDLLAWKPSILDRYYRAETLASERARRTFVLPDGALG